MQTIRQRRAIRDFRAFSANDPRIDYGYADRQRFLRGHGWLPEGLAFAIACAVVALFLVVGVPA